MQWLGHWVVLRIFSFQHISWLGMTASVKMLLVLCLFQHEIHAVLAMEDAKSCVFTVGLMHLSQEHSASVPMVRYLKKIQVTASVSKCQYICVCDLDETVSINCMCSMNAGAHVYMCVLAHTNTHTHTLLTKRGSEREQELVFQFVCQSISKLVP